MQSGGVGSDATVVGRGPVAFSGCLGQCASTHNLYAIECPSKILAVWRALLFLSGEGANGSQGPSIRPHGELLLLLMQKKPTLAFNPQSGWFLVPELKDESEVSKDEQADSSSEINVGNGALFVIGLQRSGGARQR